MNWGSEMSRPARRPGLLNPAQIFGVHLRFRFDRHALAGGRTCKQSSVCSSVRNGKSADGVRADRISADASPGDPDMARSRALASVATHLLWRRRGHAARRRTPAARSAGVRGLARSSAVAIRGSAAAPHDQRRRRRRRRLPPRASVKLRSSDVPVGHEPGGPAQELAACDSHLVTRVVERHEPALLGSKPFPRAQDRYRADSDSFTEPEDGDRSTTVAAVLLRHTFGRFINRELKSVSPSHKRLALSGQSVPLLARRGFL